jgi:hypothetical protein
MQPGSSRQRSSQVTQAKGPSTREKAIRGYTDRTKEGLKRIAEGGGYGNDEGYGSRSSYLGQAIIQAVLAGFLAAAPQTAGGLIFTDGPTAYSDILFRIIALGFTAAAVTNWVQEAAAKAGMLDEDLHRRANGTLSFFAAANLFITLITYIPNPILYPKPFVQVPAAAAIVFLSAAQWWVAGRNYAKYAPEGANPVKIIKSFVGDFSTVTKFDGLNSGIYAFLTVAFVGAGFSYLLAPSQTLDLIFGTNFPKTPADLYLWQLIGGVVSIVAGSTALTQRDAALQNNFSLPNKRTLMAGLGVTSIGHTLLLATLLGTDRAGPLLFPLGFVWGLSAVASSLIAIKPKE